MKHEGLLLLKPQTRNLPKFEKVNEYESVAYLAFNPSILCL